MDFSKRRKMPWIDSVSLSVSHTIASCLRKTLENSAFTLSRKGPYRRYTHHENTRFCPEPPQDDKIFMWI